MEKRLRIGEVVWAKIRGFPWWPGVIGKIYQNTGNSQETKILVNFIGDYSHAELPISKIENFETKYDEYSKTKKRNLINSISIARKIVKGEISFNNNLKFQNNVALKNSNNISKKQDESKKNNDGEDYDSSKYERKKETEKFLTNKRNRSSSSLEKSNTKDTEDSDICKISKKTSTAKSTSVSSEFEITAHYQRRKVKYDQNKVNIRKIKNTSETRKNVESNENLHLDNQLNELIRELVFLKIELPSYSSNKLIINALDDIYSIINKIKVDNLHELIKDFIPFLICLINNKNSIIISKATGLFSLIEEKILENIFGDDTTELVSNIKCEENFIEKLNEKEFLNNINKALEKDKKIPNKLKNSFRGMGVRAFRDYSFKNKELTVKNWARNGAIKEPRNVYNNKINNIMSNKMNNSVNTKELLNINLHFSREEDSNLISELSVNSEKTDCEDSKNGNKVKFFITPLEKNHIYSIFSEYFTDYLSFQNETDFHERLTNGDFFLHLNSIKGLKPVKYHYLRRRICYKFYKVFYKLLKNMKMDNETIKNLSIFLEFKARGEDPEMGDKYKNFISSIFNKIKVNLNPNIPAINELKYKYLN